MYDRLDHAGYQIAVERHTYTAEYLDATFGRFADQPGAQI